MAGITNETGGGNFPLLILYIFSRHWRLGNSPLKKNNKGAIQSLVAPHKGKNAKELSKIVYGMLLPYKEHVHTITVDNGSEFADYQNLAKKLLHTHLFPLFVLLRKKG